MFKLSSGTSIPPFPILSMLFPPFTPFTNFTIKATTLLFRIGGRSITQLAKRQTFEREENVIP